jgi:integrase
MSGSATSAAKLFIVPSAKESAPDRAFVLTPSMPRHPKGPRNPDKPARRRKPPVSLSDEQLLALLALAHATCLRDWVLILVTYWHGLRASEAVGLVESDFDLAAGEVLIDRGKGSDTGQRQTLQEHENPLLNERAAVEWWLANRGLFGVKGRAKQEAGAGRRRVPKRQQSSQIVAFSAETPDTSHFPPGFEGPPPEKPAGGSGMQSPPSAGLYEAGNDGKGHPGGDTRLFPIHRSHFWKLVHRYALAAGIPKRKCKTHMLKHTIAKHLVRAGHPLNEIQEWMGWTTIETMNWYTRADEEELGHRIGDTIRAKDGLRQVVQGRLFP